MFKTGLSDITLLNQETDHIHAEAMSSTKNNEYDKMYKVIILGDTGIGKSCILKRLTDNAFLEDHDVTVGVEFGLFQAKVEDQVIRL
jgi:GTPase SAR1 family protein